MGAVRIRWHLEVLHLRRLRLCVPYVVASVPVSTTCTLSPRRRCVQIEMRGVRLTSWTGGALLQVWEIYNHLPSYMHMVGKLINATTNCGGVRTLCDEDFERSYFVFLIVRRRRATLRISVQSRSYQLNVQASLGPNLTDCGFGGLKRW